jgi:hypothetical protein
MKKPTSILIHGQRYYYFLFGEDSPSHIERAYVQISIQIEVGEGKRGAGVGHAPP